MSWIRSASRWRTSGFPVDAAGALPDGTKFEGVAGLRAALLARPEIFVGTLTEKLMIYALGRGLEYYDMPAIRALTNAAARDDYRFSTLISGIVTSVPFQMRMPAPQEASCENCAAVAEIDVQGARY